MGARARGLEPLFFSFRGPFLFSYKVQHDRTVTNSVWVLSGSSCTPTHSTQLNSTQHTACTRIAQRLWPLQRRSARRRRRVSGFRVRLGGETPYLSFVSSVGLDFGPIWRCEQRCEYGTAEVSGRLSGVSGVRKVRLNARLRQKFFIHSLVHTARVDARSFYLVGTNTRIPQADARKHTSTQQDRR